MKIYFFVFMFFMISSLYGVSADEQVAVYPAKLSDTEHGFNIALFKEKVGCDEVTKEDNVLSIVYLARKEWLSDQILIFSPINENDTLQKITTSFCGWRGGSPESVACNRGQINIIENSDLDLKARFVFELEDGQKISGQFNATKCKTFNGNG